MYYVITAIATFIVTFIIVSLWNIHASAKIRANQTIMFEGLFNELNNMANELGHSDIITYLRAKKGNDYADIAEANIVNLFGSLTDRGSDNIEPGSMKGSQG